MKNEMTAKFKTLWKKGYTMGDIAWMLDISIVEVGELVRQYRRNTK